MSLIHYTKLFHVAHSKRLFLAPLKKKEYNFYVQQAKEESYMPIITVKMFEGRTDDQKKALVEKVTDAVVETTGASKEAVTIVIEEMTKNNYAVAGKRASDD
ncbi:2-hydroxymuconate tautomerase [Bacillus norwichensis]|nr:2-hydroxymuconate tautomerase [Bacillus norwichensis]